MLLCRCVCKAVSIPRSGRPRLRRPAHALRRGASLLDAQATRATPAAFLQRHTDPEVDQQVKASRRVRVGLTPTLTSTLTPTLTPNLIPNLSSQRRRGGAPTGVGVGIVVGGGATAEAARGGGEGQEECDYGDGDYYEGEGPAMPTLTFTLPLT